MFLLADSEDSDQTDLSLRWVHVILLVLSCCGSIIRTEQFNKRMEDVYHKGCHFAADSNSFFSIRVFFISQRFMQLIFLMMNFSRLLLHVYRISLRSSHNPTDDAEISDKPLPMGTNFGLSLDNILIVCVQITNFSLILSRSW